MPNETFQYEWLGEWRLDIIFNKKYGYNQQALMDLAMAMHSELIPGEMGRHCTWTADPGNDMITCAHGYRLFKSILARGAGMNRN